MNFIAKCSLSIWLITVCLFLVKLSYDEWGSPDNYIVVFLTTLCMVISGIGIIAMIMGDKFLYMIYGEPSNRNNW